MGLSASVQDGWAQISINNQAVCWAWIDDGRLKVSVSGGPTRLDRSELLIPFAAVPSIPDTPIEID